MTIEFLDHTADVAVRISAGSRSELFGEALRAFNAILLEAGGAPPRGLESRPVDLRAPDGECLLVAFLQELIFLFDAERFIAAEVGLEEIDWGPSGARLRGRLAGERFDPLRHRLHSEVKAATYHGIEIREAGGRLSVDVVFDL